MKQSSEQSIIHLAKEIWSTQKKHGIVSLVVERDAALVVDASGSIKSIGSRAAILSSMQGVSHLVVDHGASFLIPGFVDPHLHCPQLDVIGSGGLPLLGWLEKYVFPAELTFADRHVAKLGAKRLSRELRKNGITTAAIFSSVHCVAADELFSEFEQSGLRLVSGKTSMDQGAPKGLLQNIESDLAEQESLIKKWHGRENRLFYAITPRFALSCSAAMLRGLGDLAAKHQSCFIQTHISENKQEVLEVTKAYGSYKDYLAVYEDNGLLGSKTLLAHGIYLSDAELSRIARAGATIIHCPTSNTFLGSGLFGLRRALDSGARVCLASDIGAGTSLSPWHTMMECYKVQSLQGSYFSSTELLYHATLAGAEALGFDGFSGSLATGKYADFLVLNASKNQLLSERLEKANSSEERLSAFMAYGDERVIKATYVAGKEVFSQSLDL